MNKAIGGYTGLFTNRVIILFVSNFCVEHELSSGHVRTMVNLNAEFFSDPC